jgi:hypothetical protein
LGTGDWILNSGKGLVMEKSWEDWWKNTKLHEQLKYEKKIPRKLSSIPQYGPTVRIFDQFLFSSKNVYIICDNFHLFDKIYQNLISNLKTVKSKF